MRPEEFSRQFEASAARARTFAQRFVHETLPEALLLRVELNSSNDSQPLCGDERVFVDDSAPARRHHTVTVDDAVSLLWRDGRVPEWINLTVVGIVDDVTIVEALCCGRYTGDDGQLYYERDGAPSPFQVLGPELPDDHVDGERFSIHRNVTCRRPEELRALGPHAAQLRSLALHGAALDLAMLDDAVSLGALEILELNGLVLDDVALQHVARRCPQLRVLRMTPSSSSLSTLPPLPHLELLSIDACPAHHLDLSSLGANTSLQLIRLAATSALSAALPTLAKGHQIDLELQATSMTLTTTLPPTIGHLSLQICDLDDDALLALVAPVESVRTLTLSGTPVGDDVVAALHDRWSPSFLDVADTKVTDALLRRLRAEHPKLRLHAR